MLIGRQSVRYAALAHEDETDGVAQRIRFIKPVSKERDCGGVHIGINPNYLDRTLHQDPL